MKFTGTLTLKVVYDDVDYADSATNTDKTRESMETIKRLLRDLADYAADHGLMSGETELIVEEWDANVEVA